MLFSNIFRKRFIFRYFSYNCLKYGENYSKSYKKYITRNDKIISPFHDISLYHDEKTNIFNMLVEIPKFTNYKMELSKYNKMNPIMFDVKNGKVRVVHNIFPYHGYIWNYGYLPQTWENPFKASNLTNLIGDNDPIDICEIGSNIIDSGTVIQVKVLGILGMIDQGEMDWKVIVINTNDPLFDKLNDIKDVEKIMPGLLNATRRWFQYYKVPDGKPETRFAFNGEFQDKNLSLKLICETHEEWRSLVYGHIKSDIECSNLTIDGSPFLIKKDEASQIIENENKFVDIDKKIDGKWYFIDC